MDLRQIERTVCFGLTESVESANRHRLTQRVESLCLFFVAERRRHMQLQYHNYEEIFDEKKGFGKKIIDEMIEHIGMQLDDFFENRKSHYKTKYGVDLLINYDSLRATQAIVDTLEDLMRLKEFHPVTHPNRLKCAAYLSYWWLQRQPVTFSIPETQKESFFEQVSPEDIAKLIHVNAHWLVVYVFGEIFTSKELPCTTPSFQKQWDSAFDYVFYFFCYRASSPKAIEAFLATSTLHPIWDVQKGVYIEK